ncbi:MAG TPA: hypothetical protein VJY39_21525 [Acidisphaera sp.]|nr:hypothetical protein [Acidisphaera sp.]
MQPENDIGRGYAPEAVGIESGIGASGRPPGRTISDGSSRWLRTTARLRWFGLAALIGEALVLFLHFRSETAFGLSSGIYAFGDDTVDFWGLRGSRCKAASATSTTSDDSTTSR